MEEQTTPPVSADAELKKWCILQAIEAQKLTPLESILGYAQMLYGWIKE